MRLPSITALALLARGASAFALLRFGCSQIAIERIDPLVNPGSNPSPHIHQNAFAASIPSADVSQIANCTSCTFSEDRSNYWTANMLTRTRYFKARNGTYKRVNQMANRFLEGEMGGMTVYYTSPYDNTNVTAFKPGFRMLAGHQEQRAPGGLTQWNAICFRCFNTENFGGDNYAPCSDPTVDTVELPNKFCPGGIRTTVRFPTCWDGTNLDSPDHMSHVSYPASGTFESNGPCPASHPVKLPQLMFEVIWDTAPYNDEALWPEDGSQPFVLSQGDNTGYGQHGDYVFGWEGDSLQSAMDASCFGANCRTLKSQTFEEANKCGVQNMVDENVDGWLDELPSM
ncbi:hypothetical protein F4777DRAFT_592542 [Nemania sp. FL0916]|nr:hypothetical protein F4777DRAFT_592542 [Nemania sp. FL0916]